jgi:hypothetical protein
MKSERSRKNRKVAALMGVVTEFNKAELQD